MSFYDTLFADAADEGAAWGLLSLMTGISEELWCASWLTGLEHSLWQAREGGPMRFGMGEVTQRQCDLLRLLSEEARGWWRWDQDQGAVFVTLDDWTAGTRAVAPEAGSAARSDTGEGVVAEGQDMPTTPKPDTSLATTEGGS